MNETLDIEVPITKEEFLKYYDIHDGWNKYCYGQYRDACRAERRLHDYHNMIVYKLVELIENDIITGDENIQKISDLIDKMESKCDKVSDCIND